MVEAGFGGVRSAVPTLTPRALSLSARDLGESTGQLYLEIYGEGVAVPEKMS